MAKKAKTTKGSDQTAPSVADLVAPMRQQVDQIKQLYVVVKLLPESPAAQPA